MPEPPPVIRLRGVCRTFGTVQAVAGADLDVHAGRTLALLGPSGCGKTTLLRLIAGFERPDEGTIEVGGETVAGMRVHTPPERRRVGMVFQDYALFPHLDVLSNIGFGLPRAQRRRGRMRRDLAGLVELVGLRDLERRFPHQLSGGQQQRVALARALAASPAVILLDEPFSNLDASLRTQVRGEVQRIIREAGATAVFVTHDQEEALAIADEVAVMAAGRIIQQTTPEALYHTPADRLVAAFVGEADFVRGRSEAGVVDSEFGPLSISQPIEGSVEVLVRPEQVHLVKDPGGDALVVGREFYGHDQMLFVRLATGRLVRARLGPVTDLAPGDRCRVRIPGPLVAFPGTAS